MSVAENLQMGADATEVRRGRARRRTQRASSRCSSAQRERCQRGGVVRRRTADAGDRPRADEPPISCCWTSLLGLAPLIARQIFDAIRTLNRQDGLTVLIVEQNANHARDRGYTSWSTA
jgi:branched-chain amino acid transport system ATP-binding protein